MSKLRSNFDMYRGTHPRRGWVPIYTCAPKVHMCYKRAVGPIRKKVSVTLMAEGHQCIETTLGGFY